jgi:putative urate catabolism protein
VNQEAYPRDMIGYGRELPHPHWPGEARIAICIAVNYEAGGESNILHGDKASESVLSDTPFPSYEGVRHELVESAFEFGSRRGIWRIFDILQSRGIPSNLFSVVMALERNPEVARAFADAGHEIVAHGYRWIDYREMPIEKEREYMVRAIEGITRLTGQRPTGWMTGRASPNTRRLIVENGFTYDRDSLSDELPYWTTVDGKPHLVVPYSFDANDMRYGTPGGFITGEHFYQYLKETFDQMYLEGSTAPKMMSMAVHDRIVGRAGRANAFAKFLDYAQSHEGVWFATGNQIAEHWRAQYPYSGA